jgi:hypothetical protein
MALEDSLVFEAHALEVILNTDPPETTSVAVADALWSVLGQGSISDSGVFRPATLGPALVTASYGEFSDTAMILIDRATLNIPNKGNVTVITGTTVSLALPSIPPLHQMTLDVRWAADTLTIPGVLLAGPAVAFDPMVFAKPVNVSLQIDSAIAAAYGFESVQAYTLTPDGQWVWLESELIGNWREFAVDTLGLFFLGIDTVAPSLTWTPGTAVDQNRALDFSYQPQDNIANPTIYLRVRTGGGADSLIALSGHSGETATGTIPADFATERGLAYNIEVRDGVNRYVLPLTDVVVTITGVLQHPEMLVEGSYQMFSVPLDAGTSTVRQLLYANWGGYDQNKWRLYRYEGSWVEYGANDMTVPVTGQAFWLKTKGFVPQVVIEGGQLHTLPLSRPYSIALLPRWNCVSNPFAFNVGLDTLRNLNAGEPLYIYVYDPVNQDWQAGESLTALEPWKGYLVWNGYAAAPRMDSLQVPPASAISGVAKKGALSSACVLDIRVLADEESDGVAQLGFGSSLKTLKHPKPDFPEKPLQIYFPGNAEPGVEKYLTDFITEINQGHSWPLVVENQGRRHDLQLDFSGLNSLPDSLEACLLDPANGSAQLLTGTMAVYIPEGMHRSELELVIGTSDYVNQKLGQFNIRYGRLLEQNFPNPFNGTTTIRYCVPWGRDGRPQTMKVRMEIVNIKGELVAVPVDGIRQSGLHRVRWDARHLPAGAYLCRLRAGAETAVNRMLFLQ